MDGLTAHHSEPITEGPSHSAMTPPTHTYHSRQVHQDHPLEVRPSDSEEHGLTAHGPALLLDTAQHASLDLPTQ